MASTYKSPYERKFGKKHPNNPAERKKKTNKDWPSKKSVKQFQEQLKTTNNNGGGNKDKTAKYEAAQGVVSGLSNTIGKLKQPAAVEQQAAPIRYGKAARSVWDEYNTEDAAGKK